MIPRNVSSSWTQRVVHTLSSIQRSRSTAWSQLAHFRAFSSSINKKYKSVNILFGSQTGTARFLATQLSQALEEEGIPDLNCSVRPMADETFPFEYNSNDCLHLFVVSTTGAGAFPDNGQPFYEKLQQNNKNEDKFNYAVFALGDSQAHPDHFCEAGKTLNEALEQGIRVHPLTLGDDGDPTFGVEDAFDEWQEQIIQLVLGKDATVEQTKTVEQTTTPPTGIVAPIPTSTRPVTKHAPLYLLDATAESRSVSSADLLDKSPHFYHPESQRMTVSMNRSLCSDPGLPYGIREMHITLPEGTTYTTGDHLLVYPRNNDVLVHEFLEKVIEDPIDPYAVVATEQPSDYQHPTNISIYETLAHTVDLSAPPSKALSKWITNNPALDYTSEIVQARRTVLDLCLEHNVQLPLAMLLAHLHPLQPRNYSIASSSFVHPNRVILTYRPVQYYTTRGILREGLCTSHMSRIQVDQPTTLVARVNHNPSFRLPTDPTTPIVLIGGGCGVAPIRAFLEELIYLKQKNISSNVHLFLSFRHAADQVYGDLIEEGLRAGILAPESTFISLTNPNYGMTGQGCNSTTAAPRHPSSNSITESIQQEGELLHRLIMYEGAHVYVCGGASTFGAAIRNVLNEILPENNGLQSENRWHEDLSD